VILRYRGAPPNAPRRRESPDLLIGAEYEVAEIFEMEGHLMARPPGETRWPGPHQPRFGIPPEWFEPTPQPIPIVSCGYVYCDFLSDFHGAILTRKEALDAVQQLNSFDPPDEDEEFDDWNQRAGCAMRADGAAALFNLLTLPTPTHFGVFRHILGADRPVGRTFAYAGTFLADLARDDVSANDYGEHLGNLLVTLEIGGFEIETTTLNFWQGTGGGDRLINAPPDGRLIYGTDNPPDMLYATEDATDAMKE